jgi:hypothetical protein
MSEHHPIEGCYHLGKCLSSDIARHPVARSQRQRSPHDISRHLLAGASTRTPWCGGDSSRHEAGIFSDGDSKRM